MTPPEFDVRTRVHEYGGGSLIVADGVIYFANIGRPARLPPADGRQCPEPITPEATRHAVRGLLPRPRRNRLLCIREDHSGGGEAGQYRRGDRPGSRWARRSPGLGLRLLLDPAPRSRGNSSPGCPGVTPTCRGMATELWVADVGGDGGLEEPAARLPAGSSESIFQPEWSPGRRAALRLGPDRVVEPLPARERPGRGRSTRWKPSSGSRSGSSGADVRLPRRREHPLRLPGRTAHGIRAISMSATRSLKQVPARYTDLTELRAGEGFAVLIAGSPTQPWAVVRVSTRADRRRDGAAYNGDRAWIRVSSPSPRRSSSLPRADWTAYAYFYRPRNPLLRAPAGERPPLLGAQPRGPTSSTSPVLSLGRQFWTSRGFAVLDVDYGGSTGYGRAYRERLQRPVGRRRRGRLRQRGALPGGDRARSTPTGWPSGAAARAATPRCAR